MPKVHGSDKTAEEHKWLMEQVDECLEHIANGTLTTYKWEVTGRFFDRYPDYRRRQVLPLGTPLTAVLDEEQARKLFSPTLKETQVRY
jgi:hypothetical protein